MSYRQPSYLNVAEILLSTYAYLCIPQQHDGFIVIRGGSVSKQHDGFIVIRGGSMLLQNISKFVGFKRAPGTNFGWVISEVSKVGVEI